MADNFDQQKLDDLMKKAGLGERSRKKMHEANSTAEQAPSGRRATKPEGHGAPSEHKPSLSEF